MIGRGSGGRISGLGYDRNRNERESEKRKLKLFFANIFWTITIFFLANTFVWLYLGIKSFLNPQGFWQNLFLLGFGTFIMGSFQVIFWVVGLVLIVKIWTGYI